MVDEAVPEHRHHKHLEQARAQVIELLSRQAVERDLVVRSEKTNADVVTQLVERQHRAALAQRLASLHPTDIAFVLESLSPEPRQIAFGLLKREVRGAVLLETSETLAQALVRDMAPAEIAQLVAPLNARDTADLLDALPEQVQSEVMACLDQADQAEVRAVLSFPEGSVGAAMDLDMVSVPEGATLAEVQSLLRRHGELPPHSSQLFVVDREQRLCGLLPISKLVLGEPEQRVRDALNHAPYYLYTDDSMRDAVQIFEKYDLVSVPVLNLHQKLVGRITVDAVVDALNERAQHEGLRQVGLSKEDEDLRLSVHRAARRRWPWLFVNLCTAFFASRVIGAFEPVIAKVVALATLMPIVASIGGNAGNQSVALVVQGMAGAITDLPFWRLWIREATISALNGVLWGGVLGLVTLLIYRDPGLALVASLSLVLNLIVAASVGVATPMILKKAGRDPVLGSSIMLTAATDSMGFFIVLGLSALFLVH